MSKFNNSKNTAISDRDKLLIARRDELLNMEADFMSFDQQERDLLSRLSQVQDQLACQKTLNADLELEIASYTSVYAHSDELVNSSFTMAI